MDGFLGTTCDTAFCDINQCQNNGLCNKEVCYYDLWLMRIKIIIQNTFIDISIL